MQILTFNLLHSVIYLFLLYPVIDLDGGLLVSPEEANNICSLWVQDVPIFITDNEVQLQDPAEGRGEKENEK